jgi:hypothetical protein
MIAIVSGLAAACPQAMAEPVELPARKPGYWEIRMVHESPAGSPDTMIHACIDAATDKALMDAGLSLFQESCVKPAIVRQGDDYVWTSVCTIGEMKTSSHVVANGDFQSRYTMKITGEITGMPAVAGMGKGPLKTALTQTTKWLADTCPDGIKPGDVQMPGGLTVNANDAMKAVRLPGNRPPETPPVDKK